jgi:hypothetical protein
MFARYHVQNEGIRVLEKPKGRCDGVSGSKSVGSGAALVYWVMRSRCLL